MKPLAAIILAMTLTQGLSAQLTGTSTGGPSSNPGQLSGPAVTTPAGTTLKAPEWKKETWQWGITTFVGANLEGDLAPLAVNLPLQLAQSWSGIARHAYTADEIRFFREQTLKRTVDDERKRLADLLAGKDNFLFRKDVRDQERLDQDKKIADSRTALKFYEGLTTTDVAASESSAVKMVDQGDKGSLLEPVTGPIGDYMKGKGLDLLITGELSVYRKTYLRLTLRVWGVDGNLIQEWKDDLESGEAMNRIQVARTDLTARLLGRTWSDLSIVTKPGDCQIYLDDQLVGVGSVNLPYHEPGVFLLRLQRPDYQTVQESLDLKPTARTAIQRELKPKASPTFQVTSDPPGAAVYLASLWVGQTPVDVPRPQLPSLLELRLAGYENLTASVVANQSEPLTLTLRPLVPRIKFQEAKDRFYTSMAVFTFSLIGTVLLQANEPNWNAIYKKYVIEYTTNVNSLSPTDAAQLRDRTNFAFTMQQTFQNGGYIGWGVTGLAFGWVLWELAGYLSASEAEVF